MTRLDSSIQEYSMASIYEQIGGEAAIQAAVEIFYRKVLSDDRIARFFDDVDMDHQIAKQKSFLTMVTGGPNAYTGKNMRDAHHRLVERGLDDTHVDAVIQHLGATLSELGVDESIIQQIASAAEGLRDDVLCR
jgi:hemoglobin